MRAILLLLVVLSLGACGFHLRGHNLQGSAFPFKTLHLKHGGETPFVSELQRYLTLSRINMVPSSAQAELTLEIVSEIADKQILSLSGGGQVREFQLNYRVSIRAYDKEMQDWLSADEITLQRTLSYDDAQILAKEQEEALIYRDMRSDAAQQVLRRLSRAKPRLDPVDLTETESKPETASDPVKTPKPSSAK